MHEWTLSGFSSLGPGKVSSAPFELYGRRWSLLLHPRGCGANAQGTHVSAYLRLEHGPACDNIDLGYADCGGQYGVTCDQGEMRTPNYKAPRETSGISLFEWGGPPTAAAMQRLTSQ